jgi:hypothetical protein
MVGRDSLRRRARYVLSLIILIANVVAPFHTSAGRAILNFYGPHARLHPVAGVRADYQPGPALCFRAVVGFVKHDSVAALPTALPTLFYTVPTSPTSEPGGEPLSATFPSLSPPLRC